MLLQILHVSLSRVKFISKIKVLEFKKDFPQLKPDDPNFRKDLTNYLLNYFKEAIKT